MVEPSMIGARNKATDALAKRRKETAITVLLVIGFITYFIPREYAIGNFANDLWQAAAVMVSVIALIYYISSMKMSLRWAVLMLFLLTYYVGSTFLAGSDGNRTRMLFYAIEVGGFITLVECGMSYDKTICLKAFLIAGLIMCAAHYVTFLLYRNYSYGMKFGLGSSYGELSRHPWFLLTHDNGSVFHFLPVLCCLWYWALGHKKTIWIACAVSALVLYMYWSLWSVTAMVVMTGAVIFYLVFWQFDCPRLRTILTYRRALVIGVVFCGGMLLFYTNDFLVDAARAFGKNTVIGRGNLWQYAMAEFLGSPIYGAGFESDLTTILKLGFNHCHNIVMQVLYTGGVISAAIFLIGLLLCDIPKTAAKEKISKGQAILCVTVLAIFIAGTFDWDLHNAVQFFPFIMFHYTYLDSRGSNGVQLPEGGRSREFLIKRGYGSRNKGHVA